MKYRTAPTGTLRKPIDNAFMAFLNLHIPRLPYHTITPAASAPRLIPAIVDEQVNQGLDVTRLRLCIGDTVLLYNLPDWPHRGILGIIWRVEPVPLCSRATLALDTLFDCVTQGVDE